MKQVKRPVRNLHSDKSTPPRFCDVIVDGGTVLLQKKVDKNKYETIPWEDVVTQVEIAKQQAVNQ